MLGVLGLQGWSRVKSEGSGGCRDALGDSEGCGEGSEVEAGGLWAVRGCGVWDVAWGDVGVSWEFWGLKGGLGWRLDL